MDGCACGSNVGRECARCEEDQPGGSGLGGGQSPRRVESSSLGGGDVRERPRANVTETMRERGVVEGGWGKRRQSREELSRSIVASCGVLAHLGRP